MTYTVSSGTLNPTQLNWTLKFWLLCSAVLNRGYSGLFQEIWHAALVIDLASVKPLAGTARHPLFSVILSRHSYLSIYQSTYVCLVAYFRRCKLALTGRLWLWVYVIYLPAHCAGVTNMHPHYSLSLRLFIHRWHRRMASSSASQQNYRLVKFWKLLTKTFWEVVIFYASTV